MEVKWYRVDDAKRGLKFVGYTEGVNGYRVYNTNLNKIVIVRNVIFDVNRNNRHRDLFERGGEVSRNKPACDNELLLFSEMYDDSHLGAFAAPSPTTLTEPVIVPSKMELMNSEWVIGLMYRSKNNG